MNICHITTIIKLVNGLQTSPNDNEEYHALEFFISLLVGNLLIGLLRPWPVGDKVLALK
jgi:hypothetical protein